MQPKVTIIILNWNGKELTDECLESLKRVTYPHYKAIVVDNGSEDGSAEYIRSRHPGIRVVETGKNLGYAEGNNVGIRLALKEGADYVLLLNNDTIVDPEFVSELVNAAMEEPHRGFVGPKVYFYDYKGRKDVISFAGGAIDWSRGRCVHLGENERDEGQRDAGKVVDYVEGSCLLASAEALNKAGLLDPSYFLYWEETDLCVRGHMAGFVCYYAPQAKIWHKVGASTSGSGNIYYITRNRFWFMKKYASRMQYFTFLIYFFAWSLPGLARFFALRKNGRAVANLLKGTVDGIMKRN